MISKITLKDERLPSWPVSALGATVVAGDPQGAGRVVFETADKVAFAGAWSCSPGSFDMSYAGDEVIYVLDGEATIAQTGGPDVHLQAGDFCYMPRGSQTRWTIHKTVRKVFFGRGGT